MRFGLLTGSQKFTLMEGISESLAGRADIVELETLSLAEIHGARHSNTTLLTSAISVLHALIGSAFAPFAHDLI